jgi:hypothetical protein
VFHPDSIASFEGKPVVNDHPMEDVTPDNWKQLAIGHIRRDVRGPRLWRASAFMGPGSA